MLQMQALLTLQIMQWTNNHQNGAEINEFIILRNSTPIRMYTYSNVDAHQDVDIAMRPM